MITEELAADKRGWTLTKKAEFQQGRKAEYSEFSALLLF
jgi:hypothetical protein